MDQVRQSPLGGLAIAALWLGLAGGCAAVDPHGRHHTFTNPAPDTPRELQKVTLPEYVVEPPDILLLDAIKAVPKPPHKIESLDILFIEATGVPEEYPLAGNYPVEPGGVLNLGGPYGQVQVANMNMEEAKAAIQKQLESSLANPEVQTVALVQSSAGQQIAGEHLVGQDGTVSLGSYGEVYVAGMTRPQIKAAVEAHLTQFLEDPVVAVDIFAYNSKVYYIIAQGTAAGDGVFRLPITGNETVLDAVSNIEGLQPYSSKEIWIARPAPPEAGGDQLLCVDWLAITQGGSTLTNYQLLPGDRLFIAEDKWFTLDAVVAKITTPFERMFGFTLLGTGMVSNLRFFSRGGRGGNNAGGF